jgi:hypothetical protein
MDYKENSTKNPLLFVICTFSWFIFQLNALHFKERAEDFFIYSTEVFDNKLILEASSLKFLCKNQNTSLGFLQNTGFSLGMNSSLTIEGCKMEFLGGKRTGALFELAEYSTLRVKVIYKHCNGRIYFIFTQFRNVKYQMPT